MRQSYRENIRIVDAHLQETLRASGRVLGTLRKKKERVNDTSALKRCFIFLSSLFIAAIIKAITGTNSV